MGRIRSSRWFAGACVLLPLVIGGCARQTPQEVADLNRALSGAKDDCAGVYAPDKLGEVEAQVGAVNDLADARKFRKARKQARSVQPSVEELRRAAAQARDAARASAQRALDQARATVAEADRLEAATYAASEYQAAKGKLAEAERAFADPCRYRDAEALAGEADELARKAGTAAVAEKRRREEEQARRQAEEEARRRAEEEARRRAEEEARRAKPSVYEVQRGDYLWKISGMAPIYGAHKFWPLIYDANRNQVRDPDLIYPGQRLTIPREMSGEEMMTKLRRMWAKAARGEPL